MLKCTGQGIGHGLGGFPVQPVQAAGPVSGCTVSGCTVRPLPAPPGYQAAVALAGPHGITARVISAPAGTAAAEVWT